ncbi:MAG: DUF5615 family PIN-like protein [Limnothrix sp.]
MSSFRFIADVHISPKTIAALTDQGYDIIRCTDILPANAPDIEILEFARTEDRIVLTQDLDFSMLVAINNYDQPSLITLRLSSAKPDIVQIDYLKFYQCLNKSYKQVSQLLLMMTQYVFVSCRFVEIKWGDRPQNPFNFF